MKLIEDVRDEIDKKYFGKYSIHTIGFRLEKEEKSIVIYHSRELNESLKKLIENDAKPYKAIFHKEKPCKANSI